MHSLSELKIRWGKQIFSQGMVYVIQVLGEHASLLYQLGIYDIFIHKMITSSKGELKQNLFH